MQKDAMNEMVLIDDDLLDRTSEKALCAPRLRMNHNFHTREDEPVNRLLNAMEPGTYLPVHRHTAPPKRAACGGQQAGVPTMFYYAMLRTRNAKSGKSVLRCSREELQCAAFVMSHAMQKGHKPSRSDMRSVAEVERLSGFQFFTNVPNAPKDTYNPSDWGL